MDKRTLCHASPGRQQGAALVISLVLLMVCLMLGVSSMQASLLDERLAGNHLASVRAQMAAEVGAAVAVNKAIDAGCNEPPIELLTVEESESESELPVFHDNSSALDFYETHEGESPPGETAEPNYEKTDYGYIYGKLSDNKLIILSRGESGSAVRFFKVVVSAPCGESIFVKGMVAGGDIIINGSSVFYGNVHANGKIKINGSYVQRQAGAEITEANEVASEMVDIPDMVFPNDSEYIELDVYFEKVKGELVPVCEFSGSGSMKDKVYYCPGNLNVTGGEISNVTLLAEGSINHSGSIKLGEADELSVVMAAKKDITLNGSSWMYGVLWAGGSIYHNGSSRIYGAVVAGEDIYRNGGMEYTQIKEIGNSNIPLPESINVVAWEGVY